MNTASLTKPLGPNTVNRTANLPLDLDRALGRLTVEVDRSKSDLMRRLVKGLVGGTIKASQLGLLVVVGTGLGLVAASVVQPDTDLMRARAKGRGRLVMRVRGRREEFTI